MLFSIHWQRQDGRSGRTLPLMREYAPLQLLCYAVNRRTSHAVFFWVVAEIEARILFVNKSTRLVVAQFDDPGQAALYTWGKDFNRFDILKDRRAVYVDTAEISDLKKRLELA